jgi:aspartate racemase
MSDAAGRGPRRTVGVLGGLGPDATLDFFAKVLAATPARSDQEHLHLIIDNDPSVPNRNDAVAGRGPSPAPQLTAMARRLEGAGADFLVMVCNAAHAFQGAIVEAVGIPLVSIIDQTVDATLARSPAAHRVGVLAAEGALDAGLYQRAFEARGVEALVPEGDDRARFMDLMYAIKSGDKGGEVARGMLDLARALHEAGAEALVAGCTEVPLVLTQEALRTAGLDLPLVASTDALVEATVAIALGERPLPASPA